MALVLSEGIYVRFSLLLGSCLFATGCAATATPQPRPVPVAVSPVEYQEAASSALVFDVPMDRGNSHPELARAGRVNSVFLGFDLPTTECFITASDAVSTEFGDFINHETVSVKSGTRIR